MSGITDISRQVQIVWTGRGGQGIKLASMMLATAMFKYGLYAQTFPEYGAERQGAPVKAYTRISRRPIRTRCGIQHPEVIVITDSGMLNSIDIKSVQRDAVFVVNSSLDPAAIREQLKLLSTMRVISADATGIALKEIGENKPNAAMLGLLSHVFTAIPADTFRDVIQSCTAKMGQSIEEANIRIFDEAKESAIWA